MRAISFVSMNAGIHMHQQAGLAMHEGCNLRQIIDRPVVTEFFQRGDGDPIAQFGPVAQSVNKRLGAARISAPRRASIENFARRQNTGSRQRAAHLAKVQ